MGVAVAVEENQLTMQGKPIWAAALWQDIAACVANMILKVPYADAHVRHA